MRSALRTLVETVATGSGLAAAARRRLRDRIAIVAYHNVVPDGQAGRGDSSLHLPLNRFVTQVERLSRTHKIVDLREIDREIQSPSPRPAAVITFDDAYRGAVTLALPELVQRGIPAVVFVSPGLLGEQSTWWDELAEHGLLTAELRGRALQELAGSGAAIREAFVPGGQAPPLPRSYGIATRDELMQHVAGGISVGSHAWEHEHLPSLDTAALDRSLDRSLAWVQELGGLACPWLALPYGAGDRKLGRRAIDLGYDGVVRIDGGLWRPGADTAFVPRINVPAGLTPRGLELRTSGLR